MLAQLIRQAMKLLSQVKPLTQLQEVLVRIPLVLVKRLQLIWQKPEFPWGMKEKLLTHEQVVRVRVPLVLAMVEQLSWH